MASQGGRPTLGERSLPPIPGPPAYSDNERASTSQIPGLRRTGGMIRSSMEKPRLSLSPVPGGMPGQESDGSDTDSWSEVQHQESRIEAPAGMAVWPSRPHGPRPNPSPQPHNQLIPQDMPVDPGTLMDSPDTVTPQVYMDQNTEPDPNLNTSDYPPSEQAGAPLPLTIAPDSPEAPILLPNGNTKLMFRMKNPNDLPVAFKVMTTQSKVYSVRPNYGMITAGEVLELEVHAPPDVNRRRAAGQTFDRFAVLSTFLPEGESTDREDISSLFPRKTAIAPNVCTQKFRIRPLPVPASPVADLMRSPRPLARPLSPFGRETIASFASPAMTAQGLPPSILNPLNDTSENGPNRARSPAIRFIDNPALPSLTNMAMALQQQPSPNQGCLLGQIRPLERTIGDIQTSMAQLEALIEALKTELAVERSRIHTDRDDEPAAQEYVLPPYLVPERGSGGVRPNRVMWMAITIFLGTYFGRIQGLL